MRVRSSCCIERSIELHLKTLVDEGSNFLKEGTDPLSLAKTHSLRWLAQIVCQIIKAVRWENEFKCDGDQLRVTMGHATDIFRAGA